MRVPGRRLPRFGFPAEPGSPWLLEGTPVQSVRDNELGTLLFPGHDNVMAPLINRHGTWEPKSAPGLSRRSKRANA